MKLLVPAVLSSVLMLSTTRPVPPHADDLVRLVRVPDGGVQPEVAVDRQGIVHLVYLAGEPATADVFYSRSVDGGSTFSRGIRVNSQRGSAIATGTIRGAQIALGSGGRVHISWNGSNQAAPKPPVNGNTGRTGMPMLYSRSDPGGTRFEPQRNLMTRTANLDGGGSIAAQGRHVFVAWHAHPADGEGGEEARRVWLSRSTDEGGSFSQEAPVSDPRTGVCGCCALRMFAPPAGGLELLYRSATDLVHRDIYSLAAPSSSETFVSRRLHEWEIGACPMSSMSIAAEEELVLRTWETNGEVFVESVAPGWPRQSPTGRPAADASRRKHPRVAVNRRGEALLVWTEGTSWARGGSVAWQAFDRDGKPTTARGVESGLPVWSFASAVARPDGGFTILY